MTIICYKNSVLAADKLVSTGGVDSGIVDKIITPEPGERWTVYGKRIIALGTAGAASYIEMVKSALRMGIYADSRFPKGSDAKAHLTVMVITEDYKPWLLDVSLDSGEPLSIIVLTNGEIHTTSSVGVRRIEALVRLEETDSTAEEVVLKISERSQGCGLGVDTLDVKKWHKKLLKEEEKLPEGFEFKPGIIAFRREELLAEDKKRAAEESKQSAKEK